MEGSKILTIKPHEFNFDKGGYDHTKVLGLRCYTGDNMKVIRVQPKTWASLVREVIHTYNYEIGLEVEYNPNGFEERFNNALKEMLRSWGGKANSNFTDKLFTQPTHLKSSVYMNNQNSMLEIFHNPETEESKYITAVYSGEVVWTLNALVTALEQYGAWIEIEYIHRDELRKQLGELEEIDRQLSIDDLAQCDNTNQTETLLSNVERARERLKILSTDIKYGILNTVWDVDIDLKQFFKEMGIDYTAWGKKFYVFEDLSKIKKLISTLIDDIDIIEMYLSSHKNGI